jgi:DNA-binding winged helix-turn-helix (wHTH) protein
MLIKFVTTTVDVDARSVSRNEGPVHLTPKAFDVLVLLALARPRAVPKAEILDRVWPGTFVTDASLARTVHEIRDAIGDADGSVIRTVHGHGYAFAADATEEQPQLRQPPAPPSVAPVGAPRAWFYLGAQPIPLHDGVLTVGRDPSAEVSLPFPETSWQHVRLTVTAVGVTIEDLGSKNGTLVRGQRLTVPIDLGDGDEVLIGTTRLVFVRAPAERSSTATAAGSPGQAPG